MIKILYIIAISKLILLSKNMFSIFKKKIIVPHVRLTGVIGSVGRFKQGLDLANQQDILKKAFSYKKPKTVAISINSPGGSPVQSHLIYSYIRQLADKNNKSINFCRRCSSIRRLFYRLCRRRNFCQL